MGPAEVALRPVAAGAETVVYAAGAFARGDCLVASTPSSRRILLHPEILGVPFQRDLAQAVRDTFAALAGSTLPLARLLRQAPLDVLTILRGGLNFGVHPALYDATGRHAEVSFVSSQRALREGRFVIEEDSYEKWSVQDGALLCLGDIGATGLSIISALERAVGRYQAEGKRPRHLLVVTVGTQRTLEALCALDGDLRALWRGAFEGTTAVFLEVVLELYERPTDLLARTAHLPLTDFFRRGWARALEFELEALQHPASLLERCAIYDGGARALQPAEHLEDAAGYWRALQRACPLPVADLLAETTDALDAQLPFDAWLQCRPWWRGAHEGQLRYAHQRGREALAALVAEGLEAICQRRLAALAQALDGGAAPHRH